MLKKYVAYGIIIDFVLIGCLFGLIHLATSGNRQEMFDLFETFFRYKFEYNYSGAQKSAEAYFLQIEGKDPTPEFMARFTEHSPPVKKGSEWISEWVFSEGEDGTPFFSDENNGLLFRIDSFEWIGWGWFTRDHVRISGGYDEASLSASWASYICKRDRKGWAVVGTEGPVSLAQNGKANNKIVIVATPVKRVNTHKETNT